jgi:hypothetical protein
MTAFSPIREGADFSEENLDGRPIGRNAGSLRVRQPANFVSQFHFFNVPDVAPVAEYSMA